MAITSGLVVGLDVRATAGAPPPLPRAVRVRLVLLLGALSAVAALTIDMYLPAMPGMARQLSTSTTAVQSTLTVFVVGLAVGQVVAGPLSDAWGRRPPLLLGLGVYLVGSLGCLVAPDIGVLVAARAVQSLGAAAATVLARAIVRDLFAGRDMARFFSTLMLVNGAAPVLAPVLGGQLLAAFDWRAVFVVLALAGAALLVAVAVLLPEPLPPHRRRPARPGAQLRTLVGLARDREYLRHVLAAGLVFACVFAYISGSSFVLQDVYGLSPRQFSLVFAANGLGIVLAGQLNGVLLGRVADERGLLRAGLIGCTLAALGALVATLAGAPLAVLLVAVFGCVSTLGVVLADATALALADHGDDAGAAASGQGLLQFLLGGLAVSVMGLAGPHGAVPMTATMLGCAAAALVGHGLLGRRPS
ncbi:MFS transporter, DHA1 family, bicyclomycin/chloramphenicol resistance protein [Jatrophihabitans endophyticus]|uniref:MFS transporter, DHA1 family, bicyclomycin/chloramphenicol resistance protein n=1 Tax=Jatrophihabitans endophyticus TaxID=1206085 RepID=A0A1M5L1W9_9ACTN|nr:multidrug effflux MFS transporter [Jatrophihabitans endophyticus]SHG58991.1 MFS transporter, DHA1 family, bicyclomycin/chloramphenicol resistance protein [Jatrophihabitans endophyticus]